MSNEPKQPTPDNVQPAEEVMPQAEYHESALNHIVSGKMSAAQFRELIKGTPVYVKRSTENQR